MNTQAAIRHDQHAGVTPQSPRSVRETGLTEGFLLDLLIKTLFRQGMERPSEMSAALKLSTVVIHELVEMALAKQLVHLLGQPGANMVAEMRYQLSDKGKIWAKEALAQSSWVGAAPVPVDQFCAQVERQSVRAERLTEPALRQVFNELVLPSELMTKIGPAVNSGASILLYGPPGNGKSSIATAVCQAFGSHVYLPHAIAIGSDVVVFFDPAVHEPVRQHGSTQATGLRRPTIQDQRYIRCVRPAVITGGELLLEKFDMVKDPATGLYDAPLHLKAGGGLFVVDDFGRQRHTPQELTNRLIVPLESGNDHLVLENGRKVEVPFDTLVIFATNYEPRTLMDDAGLRRLRHKILVDRPDRKLFVKILLKTAERSGLEINEEILAFILFDLYGAHPQARFNAFHPRFLIDQCKSICTYQGKNPELTPEILTQAWDNLLAAH
ncbi:MAG: AAA family ATPase [Paracoccaceae bacterium]